MPEQRPVFCGSFRTFATTQEEAFELLGKKNPRPPTEELSRPPPRCSLRRTSEPAIDEKAGLNPVTHRHGSPGEFDVVDPMSRGRVKTGIRIPAPICGLISEWLPIAWLPVVRRVSVHFRLGLLNLLARNAELSEKLEAYLMDRLSARNEPRVWVAVRARMHDGHQCCAIERNRVQFTHEWTGGDNGFSYFFDAAFGAMATQEEVWSRVQPMLLRCMHRRENVCLFAYGQTGSGKTHTMFGNPDVQNGEGVAFRAVSDLTRLLRNTASRACAPIVEFSFLEVYNEKVYDLLSGQNECPLVSKREVLLPGDVTHSAKYSDDQVVVPQGLARRRCELIDMDKQVREWLLEGAASRMAGRTVFNANSSRSHAIATVHVCWEGSAETRLYLVDLAGSERAGKHALSAQQLKEGVNINQSLSTLARVVSALAHGKGEHVPYRDSALTWLLSDAITGRRARALMIAAVHPAHPAETLSTLRYAQEYSSLRSELGGHIVELLSGVRFLQQRLSAIKADVARALEEIGHHCRAGASWSVAHLQERMVRVRYGAARKLFKRHPYLSWTEAHWCKQSINAVGVVEEVMGVPPPRAKGEVHDGRRRKPRTDQSEEDVAVAGGDGRQVAKVFYAGRHGRPPTVLWYPEAALVDVPPPAYLKDLMSQADRMEEALKSKQGQLDQAKEQHAAQQKQWLNM